MNRYIVVRPKDTVEVGIIKHKAYDKWSFVNFTKEHICQCKLDNIEQALTDMERLKKEGKIIEYRRISSEIENSIKLKNIDLTGLTLIDELKKDDEERREYLEALIIYMYDRSGENRSHLLEETCDRIQVLLSELKTIGIEVEELTKYWNTKHLEKIKLRPRNKNKEGNE